MRVFKQKRPKGKVKRDDPVFTLEFRDHNKRVRRFAAFQDKATSVELGRRITKLIAFKTMGDSFDGEMARWLKTMSRSLRVRLAAIGLLPQTSIEAEKPVFCVRCAATGVRLDTGEKCQCPANHLADFDASLRNSRCVDEYRTTKIARIRRIVVGCKIHGVSGFSAEAVVDFIAKIRDAENLSPQTANHFTQAVMQFTKWLAKDRMPSNPLTGLNMLNVKVDQRRLRRELAEEEIARLLVATDSGKTRSKITGPNRGMLYRLALVTGLRAHELGTLTPESFNLDQLPAVVTVEAANEKARRGATLPLPVDFVELLREWLASRPRRLPLWPGQWSEKRRGATMMKHDLSVARKVWLQEVESDPAELARRKESDFLAFISFRKERADFHSLRHTYLTRVGRTGAAPKAIQKLGRHSTVQLSVGTYGHAELRELAVAINALPALPKPVGIGQQEGSEARLRFEASLEAADMSGEVIECHAMSQNGPEAPFSMPERKQPQIPDKSRNSRLFIERRGGDSNPREACTPTSFRD